MSENKINISDTKEYQEAYETFLENQTKYNSGIAEKLVMEIRKQKDAASAMGFTQVICDMLKDNGVSVIVREHTCDRKEEYTGSCYAITEKYGVAIESLDFSEHDKIFTDEIKKLKYELDRKENTINQIDDILNKLFGIRHDVGKPNEFEEILKEKIYGNITIEDFLPAEPIKVADMLISAEVEYEHTPIMKTLCKTDKGTYKLFEIKELRQIAEHLLVYCNANQEDQQ